LTQTERIFDQLSNKNIAQFVTTDNGDCIAMEVDQAETNFEVSLYAKGLELVWKNSIQGFKPKLQAFNHNYIVLEWFKFLSLNNFELKLTLYR
jgi:hypothetical protein